MLFLRPADFYRDAHQVIYAAIRDLYDAGKAIDAVTLAEELKKRGSIRAVGGHDILTEIVESVPTAANAKYYANIVKEKATNRQLIESATEIIRDGYSNQFTSQELLESAEQKIFSIAEDQVRGETLELKDIVKLAMDQIAHARRIRRACGHRLGIGLASISTTRPAASTRPVNRPWRLAPAWARRPWRSTSANTSRIDAQYPGALRQPGDGPHRDRRSSAVLPVES